MIDETADAERENLALDYELDAPPEKVWRAISIPAFREQWLPNGALADPEPVAATPGEAICYRMRDDAPPFLESLVTFRIMPGAAGGTLLRIVHGVIDRQSPPVAANNNPAWLMRAA